MNEFELDLQGGTEQLPRTEPTAVPQTPMQMQDLPIQEEPIQAAVSPAAREPVQMPVPPMTGETVQSRYPPIQDRNAVVFETNRFYRPLDLENSGPAPNCGAVEFGAPYTQPTAEQRYIPREQPVGQAYIPFDRSIERSYIPAGQDAYRTGAAKTDVVATSKEQTYAYTGRAYVPPVPAYTPAENPTKKKAKKEKKKKSSRNRGGFLLTAICFSLIGSLLGSGLMLLLQRNSGKEDAPVIELREENPTKITESPTEGGKDPQTQGSDDYILEGDRQWTDLETVKIDTNRLMTAAEVYASNVTSTVGITTTATTTNYWGYTTTSAASGSGFFISNNGHILTNFHVIEGSDTISVALYTGASYEAKLLGYDESNDIAVLKIDAGETPPVILGDSDKINVGDTVVAIGNPLGELTFSLTSGSISAKDREVTLSGIVPMELIQTDCAINSGNSGGALFNMYGEVIGVTNAKYSGNSSSATIDNIGFAIPLNNIREIIRGIIEDGYILKPYVGVSLADLGFEAQFYGLPYGAYVQAVDASSPAANVLTVGDIIVGVDDYSISASSQFVQLVESATPGEKMTLRVYRQGQYLTVELEIGEYHRPAIPENTPGVYY
ncbi:MAG: trypsin-like peptidase domain-containing protein [Oscillospiraceae bacterium]|nr:trypsin-like peptidase domain-containing protein [Oscillospiraceae bacterium]